MRTAVTKIEVVDDKSGLWTVSSRDEEGHPLTDGDVLIVTPAILEALMRAASQLADTSAGGSR